jgi:hypothetical protein
MSPRRIRPATVRHGTSRALDEPVEPANPYWAEHGVTFADPDGFPVVLVPEPWEDDGA